MKGLPMMAGIGALILALTLALVFYARQGAREALRAKSYQTDLQNYDTAVAGALDALAARQDCEQDADARLASRLDYLAGIGAERLARLARAKPALIAGKMNDKYAVLLENLANISENRCEKQPKGEAE